MVSSPLTVTERTTAPDHWPPTTDRLPLRFDLADVPTSYTARHVDLGRASQLATAGSPRAGDLVLAEVTAIGQHTRLESVHSRRIPLAPGDLVVVPYAARYAPDQFESVVPNDLGPCELVAAGGVAAHVLSRHESIRDATRLCPVGLLLDDFGQRLSVADGTRSELGFPDTPPLVLLVTGSSMNAGKTTTAARACRGFARAGLHVGAAKVTGTGSGNDVWALHDHGARPVLDFTDFGHPSTRGLDTDQLVHVFTQSVAWLHQAGCEIVVIEVADGVLHHETANLLVDPQVVSACDGILFAATDALSAVAGVDWLRRHELDVIAVSGIVSSSPLATRELRTAIDIEVWNRARLQDPDHAEQVCDRLRQHRAGR